jgi:hypothetical protein
MRVSASPVCCVRVRVRSMKQSRVWLLYLPIHSSVQLIATMFRCCQSPSTMYTPAPRFKIDPQREISRRHVRVRVRVRQVPMLSLVVSIEIDNTLVWMKLELSFKLIP